MNHPLLSSTHQPPQILHYHHVPSRKVAGTASLLGNAQDLLTQAQKFPPGGLGKRSITCPKHEKATTTALCWFQPLVPERPSATSSALLAPRWMVTLAERAHSSSLQLTDISRQSPAWLQRFISIAAQHWLDNDHQTVCCGVLESLASK